MKEDSEQYFFEILERLFWKLGRPEDIAFICVYIDIKIVYVRSSSRKMAE